MQTEQPNHATTTTQLPQAKPAQIAPQPWVKPTFDKVLLNDALATFTSAGSADVGNSYSS